MKRPRTTNFRTLPVDGLVRMADGEALVLAADTELSPTFEEHQARMMNYRGWFLAQSFPVENEFVLIRLADKYGGASTPPTSSEYLESEQQFRDEGLGRKLGKIRDIIKDVLPPEESSELLADLNEFIEVRNLLAHQPSWLTQKFDPDAGDLPGQPTGRTVGFVSEIANEKFIWTVDETQIAEWTELIGCAMAVKRVREIVDQSTPMPEREPDEHDVTGVNLAGPPPTFTETHLIYKLIAGASDEAGMRQIKMTGHEITLLGKGRRIIF